MNTVYGDRILVSGETMDVVEQEVKRSRLKRFLFGKPFPNRAERHERLDKVRGLAIFASDPISSNAYATEAIMTVLLVLGSGALVLTLPIGLAVAGLFGTIQNGPRAQADPTQPWFVEFEPQVVPPISRGDSLGLMVASATPACAAPITASMYSIELPLTIAPWSPGCSPRTRGNAG